MCFTPTEFLQRMGDYNQYCPVVSLAPMYHELFVVSGKAASIANMCITPTEFLQRMGDYNQYCPVVSLAPMYHELFVVSGRAASIADYVYHTHRVSTEDGRL